MIKCEVCGKVLSLASWNFNNTGEHRKTKDGKWVCSEAHLRDYNLAVLRNGGNTTSTPQKEYDPEAIAASKADEAAARAEKARIDLEKEKHEAEMSLKRRQQELEEKKERQKRADDLRAQGKGTQAFVVEHGPTLSIVAILLVIGIGFGYMYLSGASNAKEGAEINLKLEGIEDQIKLAIQEGNKEKALELTNQLVHPLHEKWEEQSKFDSWNGYPYYDEWWSKKRQEYKEQIMAMPNTKGSVVSEPSKEELSNEKTDAPSQPTEENSVEENTTSSSPVTSKVTLYKVNDPDGYSNLRSTPNGSIIRKVLDTETFEVIGTDGKFKKVRLSDGVEGFIHESRVISINN